MALEEQNKNLLQRGLSVLSLFDGISCGRVALERAKIQVDRYVAYEIENSAIAISKHNWNDIEYCGDVYVLSLIHISSAIFYY